ncbi:MAG: PCRF domain-containing protein, partial [Syntrophomonadaceae bacterium]|nr:PCRF domain-containing protein [Syntrophomonadaceae bacterium]
MLEKLEELEAHFTELESKLSDPAVLKDMNQYRELAKKHAELSEIVTAFREYKKIIADIESAKELLNEDDVELQQLAETELSQLKEKKENMEE